MKTTAAHSIFLLLLAVALAAASPTTHDHDADEGEVETRVEAGGDVEEEREEPVPNADPPAGGAMDAEDEASDSDDQMSPRELAGFERLDTCLRRAADTLPRTLGEQYLTETDLMTVSHVFARSEPCQQAPRPADEDEAGMRTFTSTSCATCNVTGIDVQTQTGQDTITGMMQLCALDADSGCCTCMLKYVSLHYWAVVAGFNRPTTTTTPESTTTRVGRPPLRLR